MLYFIKKDVTVYKTIDPNHLIKQKQKKTKKKTTVQLVQYDLNDVLSDMDAYISCNGIITNKKVDYD